jgi:hypothetical protein
LLVHSSRDFLTSETELFFHVKTAISPAPAETAELFLKAALFSLLPCKDSPTLSLMGDIFPHSSPEFLVPSFSAGVHPPIIRNHKT